MRRWAPAAALLAALSAGGGAGAQDAAPMIAARPGTAPPLQVRAGYAEADGGWVVRVADERGRERQRFVVPSDSPSASPWVADADGDGAADLWVPVTAGNANAAYAVWLMEPRTGRFRTVGEVSGLSFARDPGGWLVAQGRNGCCAVDLAFHAVARGGGGSLREAFGIELALAPDGTVRRCAPRGRVPPEVLRPWCASRDPAALPAGVVALR